MGEIDWSKLYNKALFDIHEAELAISSLRYAEKLSRKLISDFRRFLISIQDHLSTQEAGELKARTKALLAEIDYLDKVAPQHPRLELDEPFIHVKTGNLYLANTNADIIDCTNSRHREDSMIIYSNTSRFFVRERGEFLEKFIKKGPPETL